MNNRQLTTFVTIAKLRNFSKAAIALNYSQSTVSEQIQSLERILGVKLFERLGRQVHITDDGLRLLPYAQQVANLHSEILQIFSDQTLLSGSITVAAAETLCVFRLPKFITAFKKDHPDIQVSLKVGNCSEFSKWLTNDIADIAFTLNDESFEADLISHRLFSESMAIICSPHHPLVHKKYLSPMDLKEQNFILTEEGCNYRLQFEDDLAKYHIYPQDITGFGSVEAIKQCVKGGLAISFLPRIAVQHELDQGELVELAWYPAVQVNAQLIYHKKKWLSPIMQGFINSAMNFST